MEAEADFENHGYQGHELTAVREYICLGWHAQFTLLLEGEKGHSQMHQHQKLANQQWSHQHQRT